MRELFTGPFAESPLKLMEGAGYKQHCVDNGRICMHRRLNDPAFPRFHAFVTLRKDAFEVDLHFDRKNLNGESNHDDEWAYKGATVQNELLRIRDIIACGHEMPQINHPENHPLDACSRVKKKKSIIDILFFS